MLVDSVAGAFLLAGAAACAGAAVRGRRVAPRPRGARARARAGRRRRAGRPRVGADRRLRARRPSRSRCWCSRGSGASTGCRGSTRSWAPRPPPGSPWRSARAPCTPSAPAAWPPASALCRWQPGPDRAARARRPRRARGRPVARPGRGARDGRRRLAARVAAAAERGVQPGRARGDPHLRHDRAVPADRRAVHRHRPGGHRARHRHRPGRHGARRADRGRAAARDAHAGADRRPDRARQPPPPRRHAARHDRVGARAAATSSRCC